ncbi:ABC transporter ATP-binding protein [Aureimonas sp. N4]|uniref:ABC transporter ATP-binding protein n=1 Tax=Aureimonas sp. N4 TaxID=1638165 RepID=UPI000785A5F0|nr:ABC transporter ATP-binding protein [Aureimonas sp. N4]
MARSIHLRGVTRRFPNGPAALDDVSLDIQAGEFLALLGPSGCGKTTLLRLIAGFEAPTDGTLAFDERLVAGPGCFVQPEARQVAIVFQSYALWPHMSVGENVGYPLRVKGLRGAERARKVAEALAAVDLSGFEGRRPADLSGGQRQRVALARCLAMEPGIVLLDEPLANLDMHLRASMEETFRAFHRRTGATMVYVTHDQAEAMAMADRVAVMERGRILQVSAPATLYREPATEAVARFIGHGHVVEANILLSPGQGHARARLLGVEADLRCRPGLRLPAGARGRVCLRAEDLEADAPGGFPARVLSSTFKGAHSRLVVEPLTAPGLRLAVHADAPYAEGESLRVGLKGGWLLPEGGEAATLPVREAALA